MLIICYFSASRSTKSTPSRNVTVYPYPSSFGITNTSQSESSSIANAYLFPQGLSAGQMIIGGSSLSSLTQTSRPSSVTVEPSTSKVCFLKYYQKHLV